MSRKQVFVWISGLAFATPAGIWLTKLFLNHFDINLPILLGLSAGSFLYISMSDLIPETHQTRHWGNVVLVIIGIFFMFGVHELMHNL